MGTRAESETDKKPLRITCASHDCANDLHCFSRTLKGAKKFPMGACQSCGIDLVDWDRVRSRSLADIEFTFESLRRECVRHHNWHVKIDDPALQKARRKGRILLRESARKRIRQALGAAQPFRDGWQTPWTGNVLYYGQHATATCCRKCVEHWHGVPMGRELSEDEQSYLTALVVRFIDDRLPDLADEPDRARTR